MSGTGFTPAQQKAEKAKVEAVNALGKEDRTEYDSLNAVRRTKRSALTKACNGLRDALEDDSSVKQGIQRHQSKVEDALKTLEAEDEKVWHFWESYADIVAADILTGEVWTRPAEALVIDAQVRIDSFAPTSTPTPAPAAVTPAPSATMMVGLPKVDLPVFKGESSAEYQVFINTFNSFIHNDSRYDNVQKFIFLTGQCRGEAKKIADGFAPTASNYTSLYDLFKSTYGKPRLVQQAHINTILELESFTQRTMRSFLNTLQTSLRQLQDFKVDGEQLSPIIVPFVEKKMPGGILAKWREEIHADDNFSTKKLLSFLQERVECLPASTPQEKEKEKEKGNASKDAKPKTTALLTTTSKKDKGGNGCKFCSKKGHSVQKCFSFASKGKEEKDEFVKKNRLCWICYSGEHWSFNCDQSQQAPQQQDKKPERSQKTKPEGSQKTKQDEQPVTVQQENEEEHNSSLNCTIKSAPTTREATLLKTFQAECQGGKTGTIRCLMDDGSQNSWVTQETVNRLKLRIIGTEVLQVGVAFVEGFD